MNENERSRNLFELDNELLRGGVSLSEWCNFIVCETDTAFVAGADLATVITALAAIEPYLRAEYPLQGNTKLFDLIEKAPLADDLKQEIHVVRKYRNRWVHVADPQDDDDLLE